MLKRLFCSDINVNEFNNIDDIYKKYNYIKFKESQDKDIILDIFNGSYLPYLNTKDKNVMVILGQYFYCKNDYQQMEKYFINGLNEIAYVLLGNIYKSVNNETKMLHNYLIAVNFGYYYCYYRIGKYYLNIGVFNKALHFFNLGYQNNDINSIVSLGNYYRDIEEDYLLMMKYYLESIYNNHMDGVFYIEHYYKNKNLNLFTELLLYSKTNTLEYNPLFNLILCSKEILILFYDNIFDKTFDECNICCNEETELNILNCGHHLCYRCIYKIIDKNECPYCRKSLIIYT